VNIHTIIEEVIEEDMKYINEVIEEDTDPLFRESKQKLDDQFNRDYKRVKSMEAEVV